MVVVYVLQVPCFMVQWLEHQVLRPTFVPAEQSTPRMCPQVVSLVDETLEMTELTALQHSIVGEGQGGQVGGCCWGPGLEQYRLGARDGTATCNRLIGRTQGTGVGWTLTLNTLSAPFVGLLF